jgi:PTS system nitrogen regulatory IIA component
MSPAFFALTRRCTDTNGYYSLVTDPPMIDLHTSRVDHCAIAPAEVATCSQSNVLARLLAPEDILLDVQAMTRDGVFAEVGRLIGARHGLREQDILAGLVEREAHGSTALGQGVAIPHARVRGLTQPIAAFLRTRWAVPFDAPDAKPVSSLLVLLVPERATDVHLTLLAQAASMFCDKAFRDRLNASVVARDVVAAFAAWRPN